MRKTPHQADKGFVSIAQNNDTTDYLSLAYVQAMSIKTAMPTSEYAIIVDAATNELITQKHRDIFDYVIVMDTDYATDQDWKMNNEWQVFWLTPFKETIKLEADLLIPRDISHWWYAFRNRDVVLSTHCTNYKGEIVKHSRYRAEFRKNSLPDVYSGLMYFRFTRTATTFFSLAKSIFENWDEVATHLTMVNQATTDIVYAIVSNIMGQELTTLPAADFINFTHMKPGINNWPEDTNFCDAMINVVNGNDIKINNMQQIHPLHYHTKDFITTEIMDSYERNFI